MTLPKSSALTPRVAIYCRVSGRRQEQDGTSLDTQEAACRAKAEAEGWTLVEAPTRETHTGTELLQRPGLDRLRGMVRDGTIDYLLSYDPDRLSRSQAHTAILAEEAKLYGVALRFVTVDAFEDTPVGRFMRTGLAFASEIEVEKLKERTWRAIVSQAEQGRRLPGCRPRYGYRWTDVERPDGRRWTRAGLVADDRTAPVVRRVFALAVAGMPTRRIAAMLSADGVPTPKGGARWSQASVRNLLSEPLYTGAAVAFQHRTEKAMATKRDGTTGRIIRVLPRGDDDDGLKRTDLPDGTVEALVDAATFARVRDRLTRNRAEAARNTRPEHREDALLRSGFARCGYCGKSLTVRRDTRGPRYVCLDTVPRGGSCPSFAITAAILDQLVWRRVELALTDDLALTEAVDAQLRGPAADADLAGTDAALARIAKERAFALRQIDRIAAMDDAAEADEAAAPYNARLIELMRRERETRAEREARLSLRAKDADLDRWLHDVRIMYGKAAALTESLDYAGKRDLLAALEVKALVYRTDHTPRVEVTARVDLAKWSWLDAADPITGGEFIYNYNAEVADRLPRPEDVPSASLRAISGAVRLLARLDVGVLEVRRLGVLVAADEGAGVDEAVRIGDLERVGLDLEGVVVRIGVLDRQLHGDVTGVVLGGEELPELLEAGVARSPVTRARQAAPLPGNGPW